MFRRTKKSPNEKSLALKNRALSGSDSPPQAQGTENIASDIVVRLGLVWSKARRACRTFLQWDFSR